MSTDCSREDYVGWCVEDAQLEPWPPHVRSSHIQPFSNLPPPRTYRFYRPLAWDELERRRELQGWLGARRQCTRCQQWLPLDLFERGDICGPCARMRAADQARHRGLKIHAPKHRHERVA